MRTNRAKLGQNFLSDGSVLRRIIEAADIGLDDIVLEIGPGQGSLTYALCQKAKKVIAVEKDSNLVKYLRSKFESLDNLDIIEGDILEYLKNQEIKKIKNYKIVANIPYYLTSFLLRTISEMENPPSEMTLMVQKEVAERMCAKNGEMNLLALSVQMFAVPEIKFLVSKKSFYPTPKVDSAVVVIKTKKQKNKKTKELFELIKKGFKSKRKTLANNLAGYENLTKENIFAILRALGLNEKIRPQELSLTEWQELYMAINNRIA